MEFRIVYFKEGKKNYGNWISCNETSVATINAVAKVMSRMYDDYSLEYREV